MKRDTYGHPILDDDEVIQLREMLAERRDAHEKKKPTATLLDEAAKLICFAVEVHPEFKADAVLVGGQNWKNLVRQLRDGAAYLRREPL